MFAKLFKSKQAPVEAYLAPEATRVYAVGDIHGRNDLLLRMHDMILADAESVPDLRKVVVYLGDFIDRGDASREVIDMLLDKPLPGFESVYLMGNHEEIMLVFLDDPSVGPNWFMNGGDATMYSYGVGHPKAAGMEDRFVRMREALKEKLPQRHLDFLRALKTYHIEGDYIFVHAGLRPGRPVEDQDRSDLMWIRDEFLSSDADLGGCVVHGHTISEKVQFRHNRIGIDTGAYYTGSLTCLVLQGSDQRLLQT
jgi:serine/threonine protein phosphatase 1